MERSISTVAVAVIVLVCIVALSTFAVSTLAQSGPAHCRDYEEPDRTYCLEAAKDVIACRGHTGPDLDECEKRNRP